MTSLPRRPRGHRNLSQMSALLTPLSALASTPAPAPAAMASMFGAGASASWTDRDGSVRSRTRVRGRAVAPTIRPNASLSASRRSLDGSSSYLGGLSENRCLARKVSGPFPRMVPVTPVAHLAPPFSFPFPRGLFTQRTPVSRFVTPSTTLLLPLVPSPALPTTSPSPSPPPTIGLPRHLPMACSALTLGRHHVTVTSSLPSRVAITTRWLSAVTKSPSWTLELTQVPRRMIGGAGALGVKATGSGERGECGRREETKVTQGRVEGEAFMFKAAGCSAQCRDSTVTMLGVDGFWIGDYGGGVRVGRPVGAR